MVFSATEVFWSEVWSLLVLPIKNKLPWAVVTVWVYLPSMLCTDKSHPSVSQESQIAMTLSTDEEPNPVSPPEALPVCPLNVVTRLQDSCSSLSMVTCPEWSPTNTCRVSTSNLMDKCWGKYIAYAIFAFLSWLVNSFAISVLQPRA